MGSLLAQLLIAVSFAIAAYQDIKYRAVSDLVWIPALAGSAYSIYSVYPNLDFLLVKLGLLGGIALVFAVLGLVGQADAIALAFIGADPTRLSLILPLGFAAVVALVHISYLAVTGEGWGSKTIPIERFLKEQKWIPVAVVLDGVRREVNSDVNVARDEVEASPKAGALVEVKYGVPTVAYLGFGYVAFLVYLLALGGVPLF